MPRLRWVIFDIATQAHHEIVDSASVGIFVQPPNFFENLLARNHAAIVLRQVAQKFGFHQSEVNDIASCAEFEGSEVDGLAVEGKDSEIADGGGISGLRSFGIIGVCAAHPLTAAEQSLKSG